MICLNIWLLRTGDSKKYMYLRPHTLSGYWQENFVGKRMPEDWELPPLIVSGESKKPGDFVGWMLSAPVLSERAKRVLEPIFGNDVQFLRFHDLKEKPYYALNVLRVENWLNEDASGGARRADGSLISPDRYVFKNLPLDPPPIFKVWADDCVFINRSVAEAIVKNKLTGAALQDPSKNAIELMVKGNPINTYPGLI